MMRVSKEVLSGIKLLKSLSNFTGSQQDIVGKLVKAELKKTFVDTRYGYVGVGAVVLGPDSVTLVVSSIDEDKVTFRDGSFILNGGATSFELKLLSNSVEDFEGGIVNV